MGKVVLITGISSGFGKAIAETLSAKGYIVYGISRKNTDGSITKTIKALQADVTDVESVQKAVATVIKEQGRIDILINNAGIGISGSIEEASPEDISLQMNTNFMGYVNMIQAVLPGMRKQGYGTIVNMSSIGGLMGLPFQGFYSASKYAVEGLSEALRMELKPFHINVIALQPGDFLTNFTANRRILLHTHAGSQYESQFLKTLATIEKDEQSGLAPDYLARKLTRILVRKNPSHHYIIATFEQKLAVLLKRILPEAWFSHMLSSHYKIDSRNPK